MIWRESLPKNKFSKTPIHRLSCLKSRQITSMTKQDVNQNDTLKETMNSSKFNKVYGIMKVKQHRQLIKFLDLIEQTKLKLQN